MLLNNVRRIIQSEPATALVEAKCLALTASPDRKTATATVQSQQSGLAKVELKLDGKTISRWAWLVAGEKVDVVFGDLPQLDRGHAHELVCGSIREEVKTSFP